MYSYILFSDKKHAPLSNIIEPPSILQFFFKTNRKLTIKVK